jgi:hypothetical protein
MAALLGVSPPIGGDNRNEKMERKKWRKKKENAKQKWGIMGGAYGKWKPYGPFMLVSVAWLLPMLILCVWIVEKSETKSAKLRLKNERKSPRRRVLAVGQFSFLWKPYYVTITNPQK